MKKELQNIDPFNRPVPGQGMTSTLQNRSWENPPQHSKPRDAVDSIIEKIESQPKVKVNMLDLMAAGTPIESIVNTMTFMGFVEGKWSPDTSELIKPVLATYFIGEAQNNNIEAVLFNVPPTEQNNVNDTDLMMMLNENEPDKYAALMAAQEGQEAEQPSMEMDEDKAIQEQMAQLPQDLGGFMPKRGGV